MICYAVIDTNVLVSALLSSKNDAATVQVLGKAKEPYIVTPWELLDILSNSN